MLRFVIQQWRDVRQGLQASTQAPVSGATSTRKSSGPIDNLEKIKKEFGISSSASEDGTEVDDTSAEEDLAKKEAITIRLNPKARKVGRPKLQKKKTAASERADRKWYEASENGRKRSGQSTLEGLLASLDREQPGLWETQRRLSGIVVKFTEFESKKPKFKRQKNPVLILDAFYLLPPKLLESCIAVLPVSNTEATAISVDNDASQCRQTQDVVETVQVKDIGTFSRKQVEIFKKIQNLKSATELGIELHKWLNEEGLSALPAEYHELVFKVSVDVLSAYPYKQLEGLPNLPDFKYTLLYRATPPTWLTDAAIHACCERFPVSVTRGKRTRNNDTSPLDEATRSRILQQVQEPSAETVFLPLNFMNAHWCCVIVKVNAKKILYYDPLNQGPYMKAAADVCTHLKVSGLSDYDVVAQNNPIQFDAFSCGVYVCWTFIRQASYARVDMTTSALPRRRFELFFYLKTGRLLPLEGKPTMAPREEDDEGKPAPPSQDVDEQLQPTQVAE
ncbi:hypothetical protein PHMEG_00019536 [Phytophthora megakarya]|uniref:Ubiquitin-like protease family profile domain-containing protein n=1 Tax=Phytophthora megakarya TaxID=4795 RepID=A0A225VTW8_9STRA|nr:hypothetical protein PHMEG_00019536 [Phytophthora megakarya]